MKKLCVVFLLCAVLFPLQSRADDEGYPLLEDEGLWNDIEAWRDKTKGNAEEEPAKTSSDKFWIKDRVFEVGIGSLSVGFPKGILEKVIVIDLDELGKGFFMNFSGDLFYFKYSKNNEWGFRVFAGGDVIGDFALSEKMLSFSKATDEKSDIAGAVFAEAGAEGFFHIKKVPVLEKIKLKAGLAGFVPLFYAYQEKINYTLDDYFEFDYDIKVFSAIKDNKFSLDKKLGLDLRFGAEYPLASFLDLGVDVKNIPLVPATMTDYMHIKDTINLGGDLDELPDFMPEDPEWKTENKEINRPFKAHVWAEWRPFNTPIFSLIGSAGFQNNQLYAEPFSMECGLKARFNWANLFIATAGVRLEDRLWKTGVDIGLNFRAFELDLGIDLRSHDFAESFKGEFLGVTLGIKVGW
jgi:hypothetical protein